MKFLDDHYSKYLKKDDVDLLLRFIHGLGDNVFLKENKETNLNHNDRRSNYESKGKNNNILIIKKKRKP